MAVDGSHSNLFDNATCFHTVSEHRPWWTVDFGRMRTIFEVTLYTAEDSYGILPLKLVFTYKLFFINFKTNRN